MSHATLELADVFRQHGPAYLRDHTPHLSRGERRVMGAIVACRTAALGGHVEECEDCGVRRISYNSCRNRHCPKCQGSARASWLEARKAEILNVPYFHVVFTLPPSVAEIAFQNKAVIYALLMRCAAEATLTLAANPRHLGAKIGLLSVLHTWGQTLTHHPHVHCVVPGGGISLDGKRWLSCKPGFFLPVRALSRLFRKIFLRELNAAFHADKLRFFSELAHLATPHAFTQRMHLCGRLDWVVYAKPPFGGAKQVLAYLARYTHRAAIANSRLISLSKEEVAFTYKDYRRNGHIKTMRLSPDEFMRRFLLHVLPEGFHRIRHYGFLAKGERKENIERFRSMAEANQPDQSAHRKKSAEDLSSTKPFICPDCNGALRRLYDVAPLNKKPFHCDTS